MKTFKQFIEDLITTDAFQPSNLVGTRTPDGDFKKPGMKKQKGKFKLKKKAKINSVYDMQKKRTMYKIEPAVWEQTKTISLLNKYLEMAVPRTIDLNKKYYHGTSIEAFGESILKEGIKVPDLTLRKGKLKPVDGKVYITPYLFYAQIYAIGGDIAGNNYSPSAYEQEHAGRYGWVFVIDGNQLKDIQPDEDSVGDMLYYLLNPQYIEKQTHYSLDGADWLVELAKTYLTALQFQKVKRYDDYGDLAMAGKKLISRMTDNEKLELIDRGAHIAHTGNLIPSEAWKIDKFNVIDLKKDGSNFFEVADRIK